MILVGPDRQPGVVAVGGPVAAFVVTCRRPTELHATLAAVYSQRRRPDAVVVINRDPDHDIGDALWEEFPSVQVVNLLEQVGPAGGMAEALYLVSRCAYSWGWLLDDHAVAAPDALEELLAAASALRGEGRAVGLLAPCGAAAARAALGFWRHRVVPVPSALVLRQIEPVAVDVAGWVGLLVHHSVVDQIGYPRFEFFSSFDDYEYCLRARHAGLEIVAVPTSRVASLDLPPRTLPAPVDPLEEYYAARNTAFAAWRAIHSPWAVAFHLWRQCLLAVRDLLLADQKRRRLRIRLRGIRDGLRGRLGPIRERES